MGTPRSTTKPIPQQPKDQPEEQPSTPAAAPPEAGEPPLQQGAEWRWVTPEDAAKLLMHNDVNRDLRQNDLDSYIRMMKDGTWGLCVEPLIRGEDGNLYNGQHRLHAQVATGTSHWWLFLDNVPRAVQKTVNAGARARLADILKYNGEKNYVQLAGVVGNTYLWAHDLLGSSNKTQPLEGELWLAEHPELRHSLEVAQRSATETVIDIGATVLGTAHWAISQENGIYEADRFIMRIGQLQNEQPGSPIIALLKRMHRGNVEKLGRPTIRDQIATVIKVWNFDVEGRYTTKIIIGQKGTWKNPVPLKKDKPMTEEEFNELAPLPDIGDIPADAIDEGEEPRRRQKLTTGRAATPPYDPDPRNRAKDPDE